MLVFFARISGCTYYDASHYDATHYDGTYYHASHYDATHHDACIEVHSTSQLINSTYQSLVSTILSFVIMIIQTLDTWLTALPPACCGTNPGINRQCSSITSILFLNVCSNTDADPVSGFHRYSSLGVLTIVMMMCTGDHSPHTRAWCMMYDVWCMMYDAHRINRDFWPSSNVMICHQQGVHW